MSGRGQVIRRLVLVTSIVGLLTGSVGLAAVRAYERSVALRTAADAAVASADRTSSILDSRIDGLLDQLRLLSTRPELLTLDDATVELEVALSVTAAIEELILYDADGRPVAAAATDRVLDLADVAARPPLESAGPSVSVATLVEEPRPSLELAVPVDAPPGTPVATLVGRVRPESIAAEVTQPAGVSGDSSLVTADGTTFVDRDPDDVASGYRQPVADLPVERPVTRHESPAGPAIVAAAPLRNLDAMVVVEQLEADVLDPARSGLTGPTGVLLAVVLAIVLAVTAAGRRLLRPLGPLADGVSRLAEGERGVRVAESGVGEVAELARGFNHMAGALELRRRDLEDAERDARLNEQRLRLVVEGVEGYAIVLLDVLGDVRSWNAGAQRVTGWREEQVVGRRLTDLAEPGQELADPVLAATRTGRGVAEAWFVRPDGSRYRGELTVTALHRDDGAPSGHAAILHDVTARQVAQEALETALVREREAAAELRHANELKDEFLAVAAHEIRTPLAAILGATRILEPGPNGLDPAEAEDVRRIIWRHANDMHGIVERLLDFTQLQAGRVRISARPLSLRAELERIVAAFEPKLAAHEVALEVEDVEASLDPGFVRHVVGNLLSNAAKFSPAGTTITVRAEVADGQLRCSVRDEGPGIDPAEHELIFELFRQSEVSGASARGAGVGLTIVQRYVELVGGEVEVDSALGAGTTVTVRVPVPTVAVAVAVAERTADRGADGVG